MIRGRGVYHCHGKRKGKLIKKHKTKAGARRQHAAIVLSQKRRKRAKRSRRTRVAARRRTRRKRSTRKRRATKGRNR